MSEPRTRACTPAEFEGRWRKAEQFLLAAEIVYDVAEDDIASVSDAFVALCVFAGIAAADIICCCAFGYHSVGENHNEAITLLAGADKEASNDLRQLLRLKHQAAYDAASLGRDDWTRAHRRTKSIVERARTWRARRS